MRCYPHPWASDSQEDSVWKAWGCSPAGKSLTPHYAPPLVSPDVRQMLQGVRQALPGSPQLMPEGAHNVKEGSPAVSWGCGVLGAAGCAASGTG